MQLQEEGRDEPAVHLDRHARFHQLPVDDLEASTLRREQHEVLGRPGADVLGEQPRHLGLGLRLGAHDHLLGGTPPDRFPPWPSGTARGGSRRQAGTRLPAGCGWQDGRVSLSVIVEVLIAALVLFGVGAAVSGGFRGLADVPADDAGDGLPAGPLQAEDLAAARFPLAFRGYRMADVDAVLARLGDNLRARDEEIDRLRGMAGYAAEASPAAGLPTPVPADGAPAPAAAPADGLAAPAPAGDPAEPAAVSLQKP